MDKKIESLWRNRNKKIEIQKKLNTQDTDRIMLGYKTETEKSVYRILNLSTERINKTRNIE